MRDKRLHVALPPVTAELLMTAKDKINARQRVTGMPIGEVTYGDVIHAALVTWLDAWVEERE